MPAGRQGEIEAGAARRVERGEGSDEAAALEVEQVAAEAAEKSLAALGRRRIDAHHHSAPDVAEALALHHAVDRGDGVGEVEAGEVELVVRLSAPVEQPLEAPALEIAEARKSVSSGKRGLVRVVLGVF